MTVRKKIALLITAAGFGASLIFSTIVIWQMLEQPKRMIDAELLNVSRRMAQIVSRGGLENEKNIPMADDGYWLKIYTAGGEKLLYQSRLSQKIKLAEPEAGESATVSRTIPRSEIELGQDNENEVTFRVRKFAVIAGGRDFIVCAARPMEVILEELWDISVGVLSSLLFSSLLLLAASYFIAGVILAPVRKINEQARDITENYLDRRIPVTDERDEFSTLAHTLNRVFERLQRAFDGQKRLLSDTSHELKTPLTMMRLSLDELRSVEAERQRPEIIARMTEQTLRMERLVKNLLDLSALEILADVERKPIDLHRLLSSLLQDYTLLAEAGNIEIQTELSGVLMVEGQTDKLERLFSNLLDNAIKYNRNEGWVRVAAAQTEEETKIVISNTGPGLVAAEIAKVFAPFYRAEESRASRYGGSGLGLAIVKRIIELHGGEVSMESRPGEWTRVTVILRKGRGSAIE